MKQIHQKLKGPGLAEFVVHLLSLMGYKTKVSPSGPDRGIDITIKTRTSCTSARVRISSDAYVTTTAAGTRRCRLARFAEA